MKAKYAHFQVKETKEFIASRPVLQEMQKHVLSSKWKMINKWKFKSSGKNEELFK